MSLELSVNREQVVGFLRDGFLEYMKSSQSETTYGVTNYSVHLLGMATQVHNSKWMKFSPDLTSYLDRLTLASTEFEISLLGIVGSNPNLDKDESAADHYESLTKLPELYVGCQVLIQQYKDVDWLLRNIRIELGRQITIINILFDPQKREDRGFRHQIWGEPKEFTRAVDELAKKQGIYI